MTSLRRRVTVALLAALVLSATVAPVVAEEGDLFMWPTTGRISQRYGCTGFRFEPRRGSCAHFHGGIDIANNRGTPIRAAADGTVSHVGWDPWMPRRIASWMVIINHGGGLQTMYAHLQEKDIEGIRRGVQVKQGQMIGLMGSTGLSTGPHLHWSVIGNGGWVDPMSYISGKPERRPRSDSQQGACGESGDPPPTVSGGMGAWSGDLPLPVIGRATAVVLRGEAQVGCEV